LICRLGRGLTRRSGVDIRRVGRTEDLRALCCIAYPSGGVYLQQYTRAMFAEEKYAEVVTAVGGKYNVHCTCLVEVNVAEKFLS
jgi:hypothetical protein